MNGLLLLDKPAGLTSHGVVARVRRALGVREVGHAGTLDPQASGLLVVAVGRATRWLDQLPGDKRYRATLRLGLATDSEDIWGAELERRDGPPPAEAAVREALLGLRDLREQVPPMVSALKHEGQRLYELARQGLQVPRPPRPVRIHAIRVLGVEGHDAEFEVACGAGTYVRTLCVEAGRALGWPACLAALRRTHSGSFSVEAALPEGDWTRGALERALLGADEALAHLPARELDPAEAADVRHGRSLAAPGAEGPWRLNHGGELLALGLAREGRLHPRKVFAP